MKRIAYFLILLVITDLVDDAWAVASVLPGTSLAADDDYDDEYLPAQQQSGRDRSLSRQPVFLGWNPRTAELSSGRRGLPVGWDLTARFAPPPLYVLMSLQI
jgi:hypothetical protein